jgi:aldehyde:ferredoxin oxidoreductase
MGKLIRIHMSELTVREEQEHGYQDLAGRGLTSTVIAREVPPRCDPLGPQNKLVFAPGALSGTTAANSGRLSIGLKSPLTGGIKESNVGGTAAVKLARLGISAVVVEGAPRAGVWHLLFLSKGGPRLLPASDLAGLKNYDLVARLQTTYGKHVAVLSVGPVGERLLPTATIACTDVSGIPCRHAGRGGPGAVMGSKGLKAIVIDDNGGAAKALADPAKFKEGAKKFARAIKAHPLTNEALRVLGTPALAAPINAAGAYPTRNFREGTFDQVDKVSGEYMHELLTRRNGKTSLAGCSNCIIQCSNMYVDEKGGYITSALEYETIWAHGANLGIADLDSIARADRLCDDYGMDTMEIGAAIAVAMEAGIRQFGDAKGALELVEEVGKGTEMGMIIGKGAWAAGQALKVDRIPTVKKQSFAAYEPRAIHGMGVSYATSTMGADHTAGWVVASNLSGMGGTLNPHTGDGQVDNSRMVQILTAAMDCTGLCTFVNFPVGDIPEGGEGLLQMMSGLYGKDLTMDDVVNLGKMVLKTEHDYNTAAGFTAEDDRLPQFMIEEAIPVHNVKFTIPDEEIDRLWKEF